MNLHEACCQLPSADHGRLIHDEDTIGIQAPHFGKFLPRLVKQPRNRVARDAGRALQSLGSLAAQRAAEDVVTLGLKRLALEQILIGHMMAIAGEANQILRPVTMFDLGIYGELEFKNDDGQASGKRIYVQLKSGNFYPRTRKGDGNEVFDVKNDRHLEDCISQPADVYLVIRRTDKTSGQEVIRWMNITRYFKARKEMKSRQFIFAGEELDMAAVWKARDEFFPTGGQRKLKV